MPQAFSPEDYDHFMGLALKAATSALSRGDFPVGCVIVHDRQPVVTGSRRGSAGRHPNELEHAEIVALGRLHALGDTAPSGGLTLFSTLEPCLMCYGAILLAGISEIVFAYEDVMGGGTACDLNRLPPLYAQRRMAVTPRVRRQESLALFQRFFRNPGNDYWRDSPLARYTLGQP
jgi:tRNA(adenine34) deaminase